MIEDKISRNHPYNSGYASFRIKHIIEGLTGLWTFAPCAGEKRFSTDEMDGKEWKEP